MLPYPIMTDLLAARSLMGLSLGFHIVFASISMILPFLMTAAYILGIKKKDPDYLALTKLWLKGVAILFAVGAVSGTILSFELGLLWPTFMKHAGPIIGMPFSLEGTAFFVEAIAIGFFLYGWNKLSKPMHVLSAIVVGVSGLLSGILVVSANGWMNSPTGFDFVNGAFTNIDPIKAMFNEAWFTQSLHMIAASAQATCFLVAGCHAFILLKNNSNKLHQKALFLALVPAIILSFLLPITGDMSAKSVGKRQPIKLAAMESQFETERGAPLRIGGIPNPETGTVSHAIEIPKLLSFLAYGDFDAEVKGLNDFDRNEWPPIVVVHIAFQAMVGIGTCLMGISGLLLIYLYRRKWNPILPKWLLRTLVVISPLSFIALESGWIVTEVGRQPWIIYQILRTKDAVTPVTGITYYFYFFTCIYILLAVTVAWLMARQIRHSMADG